MKMIRHHAIGEHREAMRIRFRAEHVNQPGCACRVFENGPSRFTANRNEMGNPPNVPFRLNADIFVRELSVVLPVHGRMLPRAAQCALVS